MTSGPLRVCLVSGYWSPAQWSMSLYAEELFRLLAACKSEVSLSTLSPWVSPRHSRCLAIVPGGHRILKQWARRVLLPKQLLREGAELFHWMEPGDIVAARRLDPKRLVVTCHDLIPWRLRARHRSPWPKSWVSGLLMEQMRQGLIRAGAVITPSESTRKDLLEFAGIPPGKISVIPYGLNPIFQPFPPDDAHAARRTLRLQFSLPPDEILFLHVGSTLFYKNIETLLRALSLWKSPRKPFLVRVGNPFTPLQAALAKRLGIADRILPLGERSQEELARIYPAMDALVFPSWYEGFGRPVLESMACGTPVIAGKAGSLPEIAGSAGLLVDPGDASAVASAMERLAEDAPLRSRLRAQGLLQARSHRGIDIASRVCAVYRKTRQGPADVRSS